MNNAIISIGCNKSDRLTRIDNAIRWLKDNFNQCLCSQVYEMPAINGIDRPYLNSVIQISTDKDIQELTALFKNYEIICGRTSRSKAEGIIPLDIDIIIWNDTIVRPKEYAFEYFMKGYVQLLEAVRCNGPSLNER